MLEGTPQMADTLSPRALTERAAAVRWLPKWPALSRETRERLLSLVSPLVLLLIWQLAAVTGRIDTRFFPAPTTIFRAGLQMLQPTPQFPSGELWTHLSISLTRIAIGFFLGAVPGVVIGLAMGLFGSVRALVQPLIDATFPIPKIAVLPLFIM